MAGLKSPPKKKRDSSKPSTVLIVFLVFFVLVSIGLGVWGYYGYAGQDKLETAAKNANNEKKTALNLANLMSYMNSETRVAIGAAGNPKDPALTPDELEIFANERTKVLQDADPKLESFKKLLDALKADLGAFEENAKRYPTTYRDLVQKMTSELKDTKGQLEQTSGQLKAAEEKFQELQTAQKKYWDTALADIRKGNDSALQASSVRSTEMEKQFELNSKLNKAIEELRAQKDEEIAGMQRKLKTLADELGKVAADKTDVIGAIANAPRAAGEQPHALILDISQGKPLWDYPLGKIIRVDLKNRQVYINLGSANGMKPEVTFNIFGAGWNGRADKALKGTIEVVRVQGANSSLARITSIFDAEGREIVLGDATRGQPSREAENALKEGDLLYNPFWGARVAIAGNVRFAGQASESPAEQMRIMESFVNYLNRQGITVDAYLDLNDAQIKGVITTRTRYLIRGDDLADAAKPAFTFRKEAPKDDAEKKDELEKKEEPAGIPDRLKALNDAAAKMRQEAIDKGLFIISADNFLNAIGYRQPRSAVFGEVAGFRPSPIYTGQPVPPPGIGAPPTAPAPNGEQKADDKGAERKGDEK